MQDQNSIEVYIPRIKDPLVIDIDKLNIYNEHKWSYQTAYNRLCFSRQIRPYKRILIYLHKLIMESEGKSGIIDHKNGNGMDNRLANLRVVTHQQNMCNSKKRKASSSIYKGVYKHKHGKWCANITENGKVRSLGYFISEEEAAKAYDKEATKLQGEFARLNFNKLN